MRAVLAASVGAGCKRVCGLEAWVLAASVGAGCRCGCWLQVWVLAASVGAGSGRVAVSRAARRASSGAAGTDPAVLCEMKRE